MKFDNKSKPWSRDIPFMRIGSRNFLPDALPPSGKGYECGCRNPDEDYVPTFIAALLVTGIVEAAEMAIAGKIPSHILKKANELLKMAGHKGADFEGEFEKFKKSVADFLVDITEGFVFKDGLRQVPAWVPVNRKKYDKNFKETDKEIQGRLSRSFQSSTDLPLMPWNRFYNWNFHVHKDKETGLDHVRGRGNVLTLSEEQDLGGSLGTGDLAPAFDMQPGASHIENSFECVWDVGAFSRTPGNAKGASDLPGIMFHERWPFWPMTNDWFWAQGRWVYDCTRVVEKGLRGNDTDVMWTQLRPCRAMACYRYEGFKFDENKKRVPASRFLFFACRKGGYKDLSDFASLDPADDPEFIVDLPKAPAGEELTWPIGHTVRFDVNTVVLRPRLLIKVQYLKELGIPGFLLTDDVNFRHEVTPTVEPIRSTPEEKAPDQVKIRIPLHKLPKGAPAFGVVISMGWADPTNELARKVKKVQVKFDSARQLDKSGALRFRFCANGHWSYKTFADVKGEGVSLSVSLPALYLPEDAKISISAHGMQRRGYGEVMELKTDGERRLHHGGLFPWGSDEIEQAAKTGTVLVTEIDGKTVKILPEAARKLLKAAPGLFGKRKPAEWDRDIDQGDDAVASAIARELFFKPFSIFNRKDQPLGLIDDNSNKFGPGTSRASEVASVSVSYTGDRLSDILKGQQHPVSTQRTLRLTAQKTEIAGDAHMLGYKFVNSEIDYSLNVTMNITEQD